MNVIFKAALWMTGAIVSFSFMAVAGRELAADYDTFEIMLYRSLVGLIIVVSVTTLNKRWHEVQVRSIRQHFLRNIFHFTGQNLWFYAVAVVPLAQVFALEFTSPLWVVILAPLLLGERMSSIRALSVFLGFVGILIVTRPNPHTFHIGLVAAATAAVFFALTILLTKRLTRNNSITCILFYLTSIQLVFGLVMAGYDGHIALPSATSFPFLFLVGCAGLLAHFCLTNALSIAPASIVVPIDFARLPVIAIVAMFLYDEPLEIWVFVGALLIFAANYLNIWNETRTQRL
ncbi:DMT family transporter [Sulfitobacter guttiformis]|uniref:EamA domain-containing membrane protein RarD n=1 Tax=Sulfitobacter guttiformis TaxID=74349 RepID=A0A420DIA0_9RHOB|nr:DMT family transporter [Sulfitobacter guttiformis]KIN72312.1 Integral membrane protein [Sulfitobacter guttiformis KCTC 32187]RKE93925.1 EamA domain-containing membrane protein RarD [Sulfitobacter guttiformis]